MELKPEDLEFFFNEEIGVLGLDAQLHPDPKVGQKAVICYLSFNFRLHFMNLICGEFQELNLNLLELKDL